ncbi:flagellar brake protein [Pseudoduganella sp. FT55W]|uniref:Flagellar brake protein n=1 Tax=Duganella rivi TaxID=2666083 RepID=A0A7X4KEC5_9BURK|nr:flagellar brake protein [Duganella rivi]MYM69922.1 flagellar brake protein [Duganella rivi]
MSSNPPPSEAKTQEYEFEQMNLQVGGRIQFITHRTIKPIQHFSTLIGWVKDEYMIVKVPFENGAPISLNDGDKLTIRVFSGVNVCSFSCVVQRVFPRPLFYVHLSFPVSIQGTSLRAAMRVKVDIPAQVTTPSGASTSVFLVNLSVSGALIESPKQLSESEAQVALSFYLIAQPGNRQVRINPNATIRNINVVKPAAGDKPEVFTYGVQFIDLDPVHYTMLQNLTYEALIADRQKIV